MRSPSSFAAGEQIGAFEGPVLSSSSPEGTEGLTCPLRPRSGDRPRDTAERDGEAAKVDWPRGRRRHSLRGSDARRALRGRACGRAPGRPRRARPPRGGRARRRRRRARSRTSTSAAPTRRARTTATSRGWPLCSPACRKRWPASRSTGCAPRASRPSSPRVTRSRAGDGDLFVAGGVESMSRAPLAMAKPEHAFPRGNQTVWDTTLGWRFPNPRMEELFPLESMGETGENVAERYGVSREDQDDFALESQRRARPAHPRRAGSATSSSPWATSTATSIRGRTRRAEKLAALKPAFRRARHGHRRATRAGSTTAPRPSSSPARTRPASSAASRSGASSAAPSRASTRA